MWPSQNDLRLVSVERHVTMVSSEMSGLASVLRFEAEQCRIEVFEHVGSVLVKQDYGKAKGFRVKFNSPVRNVHLSVVL
jgi:hypothetical protein